MVDLTDSLYFFLEIALIVLDFSHQVDVQDSARSALNAWPRNGDATKTGGRSSGENDGVAMFFSIRNTGLTWFKSWKLGFEWI